MTQRQNFIKRGDEQITDLTVHTVSIKPKKESSPIKLNLSINDLKITLSDGDEIVEMLYEEDFFGTFETIQERLDKYNIKLKVCGNCKNFGFSSMAFQFSGGTRGYCTFIQYEEGKNDQAVHVLDICDNFKLRIGATEDSPFLPP